MAGLPMLPNLNMASTVLSLLLFFYATPTIQHDEAAMPNGIVGFGIPLWQDLCCQACHDSLSTLYLDCTTFPDEMDMHMGMDMDMGEMGPMGETSPECYANNTAWLQTMAYCIQENCNADGYPANKQAECFSVQALMGATEPTFQDSLPRDPPTEELAADAMWLNFTSLVNRDLYYSTHGTLGEFARSEYIHTRYSLILYLITIGLILGCGVLAQSRGLFSGFQKQLQASTVWAKLQQFVFIPALFGNRRLEPLPGNTGYVPGRMLTIFITIYVIMNVVLSSVSFRSFQPNIYFLSKGFEICEYVGNRTGTLSFVNMSMAILFAGRNNILIAITGWSQTTFMTLHRWTARVATLQAVIHSIVYTLAYWQPGYEGASAYAAKAAELFYYWGIIATIAMCLIIPFSILAFRVKFYETFLVIHIALAALTLAGCWYHIIPHFGYAFGYQTWLYICFAFWAFDRLARFGRVVYYNRPSRSTALVEPVPGCEIMHVTLFPRTMGGWGPGQHSFLYFPHVGLGKFWESHPFSIAGWTLAGTSASPPAGTNEKLKDPSAVTTKSISSSSSSSSLSTLKALLPAHLASLPSVHFLIRSHTGLTSTIYNSYFRSDPRPAEISVYNEGPYGGYRASHAALYTADTVVCLVGGIGITGVLGFIQEYMSGKVSQDESARRKHGLMRQAKRFVLLWSARELALLEFVRDRFLAQVIGADGIEAKFWCTDDWSARGQEAQDEATGSDSEPDKGSDGVIRSKMHIPTVLRKYVEEAQQTAVVLCGPGSLADEGTREVVGLIRDGYRVDIVEESFAW